jgi:DNA-binding transcriptional regulator YhcF (GntR family)
VPDSYPFYTYSGLLTPEHYSKIGNALWLFLWCISSTTTEKEKDGIVWGIVKGNKPHKLPELAKIFEVNEKTVRRWIETLETNGYIKVTRAPYGLIFTVKNSKRRHLERLDKNVQSENRERTEMSTLNERLDKNVQSRTDKSVQSNKDIIKSFTTTADITKSSDAIDLIAERFADLKTMQAGRQSYPNAEDYQEIAQIVVHGVSVSRTIEFLEQCFKDYQSRKPNGKITSFKYCKDYILDHHKALLAKEEAKQLAKNGGGESGSKNNRPSPRRATAKANAESITGGQVGWIGRKKVPVPEVPGSDGIY